MKLIFTLLTLHLVAAIPLVKIIIDIDNVNTSPATQNNVFENSTVSCPTTFRKCCASCVCKDGTIDCGDAKDGQHGSSCTRVDDLGKRFGCRCATDKSPDHFICKDGTLTQKFTAVVDTAEERLGVSPPAHIDLFAKDLVFCPLGWGDDCCPSCSCNDSEIDCGIAKHLNNLCTFTFEGERRGCRCVGPEAKGICKKKNNVLLKSTKVVEMKSTTMTEKFEHLDSSLPMEAITAGEDAQIEQIDVSPPLRNNLFDEHRPVFCPLGWKDDCCSWCTCVNNVIDCQGRQHGDKNCAAGTRTGNGCRCSNDKANGLCKRDDKLLQLMLEAQEL